MRPERYDLEDCLKVLSIHVSLKGMKQIMNFKNRPIFINALDNLLQDYLETANREEFYEILWLKCEKPLHFIKSDSSNIKGDWMYLIPPNREFHPDTTGKKGMLIAFNKSILDYEIKEFSLDVFKLFMGKSFGQGSFATLLLDEDVAYTLENIANVIQEEYKYVGNNFVLIRTLVKAFLLKLIQFKTHRFTGSDLDEKRVYHFLLLLEHHFREERSVEFYADRLNITSKRLNQILKEKLGKTIRQLLHERIILEAKHQIILSEQAIKEISFHLGFEDRSYFSRFFKKMTGLTPQEFHQQAKAQVSIP